MDYDIEKKVEKTISTYRLSYYIWMIAHILTCLVVIAAPTLVASGLLHEEYIKIVSITCALFSAFIAWANLNIVARNFAMAFSKLEKAIFQYHLDGDKNSLVSAYCEAKDIVINWTPGAPK